MSDTHLAPSDSESLLRQLLSQADPAPLHRTATPKEFRAALEKISEGVQVRPPVSDEAFTAEELYP